MDSSMIWNMPKYQFPSNMSHYEGQMFKSGFLYEFFLKKLNRLTMTIEDR